MFGKIGKTLYFGLPGNPVSAAVVYKLFVEPALLAISGSSQPFPMIFEAISESNFKATSGRLHFARGICFYKNGWRVKSTGQQGSHILSGMASANCLVLIPPDENVKSGEVVRALMLDGIRVGFKTAIKAFSELLP